ncbi:hypothetical protein K466DRAFT_587765 [Polyporus arcularius HHB13444]|uniref:Uncharacterized protein n=1 Tax=Polyporus arcularius HHB13444 TaxID=1314778 RepID=A0A5C3P846_9APHY|nr:hypothetical protein K466DRAFT_587765 [Polyporus arcularius HHB13444]
MFPRRSIRDQFNPVTVDLQTLDELPRLWYGVPYDEHKLFKYALRCGQYGKKSHPDDPGPHPLSTWGNFLQTYKKTYGMGIGLREVWGCDTHWPLFAFLSNRDMAVLDTRHHGWALTRITAMGFDVDKDAKWWVDRDEKY